MKEQEEVGYEFSKNFPRTFNLLILLFLLELQLREVNQEKVWENLEDQVPKISDLDLEIIWEEAKVFIFPPKFIFITKQNISR